MIEVICECCEKVFLTESLGEFTMTECEECWEKEPQEVEGF